MRVVYTTSSLALAVLEVLAYRKATKPLPPRHLFTVELQERHLTRLEPADLPADWNDPHSESTQHLGDTWVEAGTSLALAVPSVLAPPDVNVMLNCSHPDFLQLTVQAPETFPINPRLAPDVRGP